MAGVFPEAHRPSVVGPALGSLGDAVIEALKLDDPVDPFSHAGIVPESQLDQAPDHVARQAGDHAAGEAAFFFDAAAERKSAAFGILGSR